MRAWPSLPGCLPSTEVRESQWLTSVPQRGQRRASLCISTTEPGTESAPGRKDFTDRERCLSRAPQLFGNHPHFPSRVARRCSKDFEGVRVREHEPLGQDADRLFDDDASIERGLQLGDLPLLRVGVDDEPFHLRFDLFGQGTNVELVAHCSPSRR